jgi:hypothetical protein
MRITMRGGEASAAAPFYASSIDSAEDLIEAANVVGLDEEIALLRSRLQTEALKPDGSFELIIKCTRLLMLAVQARYRMTPQRAEELAAALERATEHLAAQFLPREVEEDV